MRTAYSKNYAKILDKHCDIILVGDSMANVLYGMKNTHKISSLNANLYTKPSEYYLTKAKLPFCSTISVTDTNNNFYKFEKYWIKKKDVVPINYKQKIASHLNLQ